MANRKITIWDVAEKAGVAPGTVSRTLNNIGYIKEETRLKVMDAIKELDYIPNRAGRTLKTTRTGLIMLAIPDTANAIYVGMIEAVNDCAKKRRHSMVLYYTEGKLEGELKAVRMLQENLVDGLFLVNFSYSDELRKEIERCDSPIVLCGMCNNPWRKDEKKTFGTLSIDVYKGIYSSTQEMIRNGHKKIAYLAGEYGTIVYKQRYDAYCQALRDHGIEYNEDYVFWENYTQEHGYEAGKKIYLMKDRPTAMVASNDLQAVGFWKACKDYHIDVPKDIALYGMDNLEITQMLDISSIQMQEGMVGEAGANLILDYLENKGGNIGKSDLYFRPTLIQRRSSR